MTEVNTSGFSSLMQYEMEKWGAILGLEEDALQNIFNDIDGCVNRSSGKTPTSIQVREAIEFLCPEWIDGSHHETILRHYESQRVISMTIGGEETGVEEQEYNDEHQIHGLGHVTGCRSCEEEEYSLPW